MGEREYCVFADLYLPRQHGLALPNLTCTQLIHRAYPLFFCFGLMPMNWLLFSVFFVAIAKSPPHISSNLIILCYLNQYAKCPILLILTEAKESNHRGRPKRKRSLLRSCHSSPIEKRTLKSSSSTSQLRVLLIAE